MNLEEFRIYCLSKPNTEETIPFGPDALVFKTNGKIFAITNLAEERFRVNLKCDPDYAIELRDEYEEIIPGWHMNKKHWNTIYLDGDLKLKLIKELIDHSYELINSSIKRTVKKK
ncbi:MAG: MmcQ/YjbR family DNA-binding protein [Saprospiraceae bacterium]